MTKQLVAIVVPTCKRATFTTNEEISLRHLVHHLGAYDKYLIRPQSVHFGLSGFQEKAFGDQYFGSQLAYTSLMLSRTFYEAFSDYEFVLIYHLDALVFSDQLTFWCEQGYDYIGAPWLHSKAMPEAGFTRVGNGGFCLRRVSSILKVLDSPRRAIEPAQYWKKYFEHQPWYVRLINRPRWLLKHLRMFNNVRRELSAYEVTGRFGEDHFWGYFGPQFDPAFKIAPLEVALRFAFEQAPQYCFAQNHYQLPFGCHAWPRYDREFWEPYLLSHEYTVVRSEHLIGN